MFVCVCLGFLVVLFGWLVSFGGVFLGGGVLGDFFLFVWFCFFFMGFFFAKSRQKKNILLGLLKQQRC